MLTTLLTAASINALCGTVRRRLNRPDRNPAAYCGGRIRLTELWNHGAAFALPIPKPALLGGTTAALLGALHLRKRNPIASGLILGGGLSNLAERVTQGKVYDYVQFPKSPAPLHRYVYNLADFAVFFGLLSVLVHHKRR